MASPNQWTITCCSVEDAPALAANNIPAFWADPHWVLSWRHRTLEYHITQVTKRFPRVLLRDRDIHRHQKLAEPDTGRILGYARWSLPKQYADKPDGTPVWPEAVVPAVSAETEKEINETAEAAHWDPNEESDVMFEPVKALREPLLARKPYMELKYLAVHPDNQGKGFGTALVESGMRVAEELGLDIFIHAMIGGVRLYRRLGFRLEAEITQDDSIYGGTGEYWSGMMIFDQKPTYQQYQAES